jgi:hypothetical protein
MSHAQAAARTRIGRLLRGQLVGDDLTRLFQYLRTRSYGYQTVKEVGDFAAHFDEREKGITTDLVRDFFTIQRFVFPLFARGVRTIEGLSINASFLKASFRVQDLATVRKKTGLSRQVAKRIFESMLAKFESVVGTPNSITLTPEESSLVQVLLDTIVVKPAFDDNRLFREFVHVIEKNKLLQPSERRLIHQQRPIISLFAVAYMHGCDIVLEDGSRAHLAATRHTSDGSIQVTASAWAGIPEQPNIHVAGPVFKTELRAADWCAPELLEGDDQSHWDYPIEVGPDQKLRRLR